MRMFERARPTKHVRANGRPGGRMAAGDAGCLVAGSGVAETAVMERQCSLTRGAVHPRQGNGARAKSVRQCNLHPDCPSFPAISGRLSCPQCFASDALFQPAGAGFRGPEHWRNEGWKGIPSPR